MWESIKQYFARKCPQRRYHGASNRFITHINHEGIEQTIFDEDGAQIFVTGCSVDKNNVISGKGQVVRFKDGYSVSSAGTFENSKLYGNGKQVTKKTKL